LQDAVETAPAVHPLVASDTFHVAGFEEKFRWLSTIIMCSDSTASATQVAERHAASPSLGQREPEVQAENWKLAVTWKLN
jgi:hypothetical protein